MASAMMNQFMGKPSRSGQGKNSKGRLASTIKPTAVKESEEKNMENKDVTDLQEEEEKEQKVIQERENLSKQQFEGIQKQMSEGKAVDIQSFIQASCFVLFDPCSRRNITKMRQDIDDLEDRTGLIEESVGYIQQVQENTNGAMQEMFSKLTELEAEAYSLKYLFKFVPLNTTENERRETNEQTEQVVNEILDLAGLREEHIDNTFRMYKKDEKTRRKVNTNPKMNVPHIFVQFSSKKVVSRFLARLRDIKSVEKFSQCQFEILCPPLLKEPWDKASKASFNLRTKKHMIVKTFIRSGEVILIAKYKNDQHFVQLNIDDHIDN